MTPRLLIKMANQVLATLRKAHSKGIAHLDIKRENILYVDKTEDFILIDWGISCFVDTSSTTKYICDHYKGTKDMISPWLAGTLRARCSKGDEYKRNDLWAL